MLSPESIQSIISFVIIIMIVVSIAKKAIKLAISIVVILFLFNLAFLWNGDTINSKLNLDKHLKPEAAQGITSFFNDFAEKRDQYGITVDTQEVYNTVVDGIKDGTAIIIDGIGKLDIKKFSDAIAEKIYEIGKDNINWEEVENEIKSQLEGISQEDLDKIMENIKNKVQDQPET